jgi:hypothetical protein
VKQPAAVKRPRVQVERTDGNKTIDADAWVRGYVESIMEREGYEIPARRTLKEAS